MRHGMSSCSQIGGCCVSLMLQRQAPSLCPTRLLARLQFRMQPRPTSTKEAKGVVRAAEPHTALRLPEQLDATCSGDTTCSPSAHANPARLLQPKAALWRLPPNGMRSAPPTRRSGRRRSRALGAGRCRGPPLRADAPALATTRCEASKPTRWRRAAATTASSTRDPPPRRRK